MSDEAQPHFTDEQRLAFGRVAELYDRARPSYPAAAIDALLEYGGLAPGSRIVEVGAGTGKATELLAARGLHVTAIEPSAEMAALARVKLAGCPAVMILESSFEAWEPGGRFDAVVSVQAWHWVDPAVRYARARDALAPGATLAAVWSFPDWERCPERDAVSRAYRSAQVQLEADFPMHPDSEPTRLAGDWGAEIAAAGGFGAAEVRRFRWSEGYGAKAYTALLGTHQDHILLSDGDRAALMRAIERCIEDSGGHLELPLTTYVCLARRGQSAA
ncbi:MAG TPA: class I SAM-dependent methyltransferase [Solirubrobacteraceae bacterium]